LEYFVNNPIFVLKRELGTSAYFLGIFKDKIIAFAK
jgi:hypothetical protein